MSAHSDLRFKTIWDTLENYKNIFYNLNIMVIVHDFDGNIREVNNKAVETFGYSEKEFLSINTDDIQTEEAQVTCRDIMEETRKHGTSHSQVSLVKKNGETFPACAYTNLLQMDNDQLVLCVIDDLTELKKVEKELRDNNIFFNSIIENIPDMIFLKDAEDLRFVRFNKAGEELLGYSKKDLIGKSDYDFFPKEEADFFTSKDREVLKSGKVLEIPEEEIHTKRIGVRTLRTKKITVYNEDSLPKYLLGVSEDITERKQLEEKFELVVESVPNAIVITDRDGVINLVNTQTESIFGYDRTQLSGQHVEILIPERHRAAHRKDRMQFSKEPKPSRMGAGRELTGRHKDGSEFPIEIDITPLSRKDGTIFLNSIMDITHRKKREEWMRIRDRAINSSPFGILITGTVEEGNQIIQCNPAFEEITGYKLDEIIGKNCRFLQGDDLDQEALPRLREAIEEGKPFHGLLRNYKKDGTLFWNELTVSPVRDENGSITHYVGIQNDVTERKKAEDALKKAHSELEFKVMERTAELVELNNKLKSEIEIRKKVGDALRFNVEQLSKKKRYEEIINTVTRAVHQSLDLERVLENAMDVILKNMTSADTAAIYMVEGDYAVMKAHRNLPDEFIEKAGRIPHGKGVVWRTILEASPRYVPDLDKDRVIGNAGRKLAIQSYAAVPFFSSNEAVGGIYIGSVNKNSFNEDEIRVFNTVSQQIGIAIENARQAQALKESQEMLRISEEHYRLLVETTNVIPWEADAATKRFTYVGPQAEKILGYPVEKWHEKDFWPDHIHPDDREYVVKTCEENSAAKKEYEFEYRMIASDGGVRWLHDVVTVVYENGEPRILRGFMVDITERKKAQYELQANLEQLSRKNRYEEIISTVTMAVHKSRNLVEVLENAVEIISRNIGVVDHVSIFLVEGEDAVMKARRGFPDWFLKKMVRIPKPKGFTWACINSGKVIYCPDVEKDTVIGPAGKEAGSKCYLSIPLKDGADSIGTINLHSLKKDAFDKDDISLLEMVGKQIEIAINKSRDAEALRNSEERYRAIIEHTYNMIVETDQLGIISYANPRHKDLLGYDPEELIGTNCLDLVYEEDRPTVAAAFRHAVSTGESVETARYRCRHKNGELRWLESTGKPYESMPGVIRGIISSRDITERKKTEDSRREIMERHQALVEHAYDIIVETTSDSKFSYVNPTFTETLGYDQSEVLGKSIFEFVHPDDTAAVMAEFAQAVTKFTTGNIAYRLKNKQGEWRWLESSGRPFKTASGEIRASITTRDITEKKRSEEELKKAFSEIKALKNQLEQENIYLQEEVKLIHRHGEIYGQSKVLESALNLAEQVANTESTVLILGETGTGKELLAHAIHNMSPRKDRPMVIVNCTTLPASLVEDELFGHEKSAFTGATSRRAGRFEIADGSTIFLDEVGELPMELQSKLLRVLQTGQFERIGGTQTLSVNSRVITATNRDLTRDVREGRFREDLFYRLNVFPISLPPLRERKEDIPLLVEAFVKEFGEKMGKSVNKISKKTMNHLMSYSWPGNVRELRNVIERAVIISGGDSLNIDLPGAESALKTKTKTLTDLEKDHIVKILNMTNWRIRGEGGAAQLLEMKPTTLESRMRRLGIERYKSEQH